MFNYSKKASILVAASIFAAGGSLVAAPSAHAAIESNVVANDIAWTNTSAPAAPSNVQARAGSKQVVLTWAPVQGAASYDVRRYDVVNNTYDSVAANTYTVHTTGVTEAVYADTSVMNGKVYGYVVNAVYGDGQISQMSMPVVAAPMAQSGSVAQSLIVQSSSPSGSTSGAIRPMINIMNTGSEDVNLSDIRVRYYFTGGKGLTAKNVSMGNVGFGANNVEPYIVNMEQPQTGADSYLELRFNAEAGIIPAGGETNDMSFTIQRSGGSAAPDYSSNSSTTMSDNNHIVLYYQGAPVWGQDPGVTEE
ncbi:cellulose binding domain-containing protein [Paenibacillus wulumuqiensis]|uniref:cellulose binding domain-containing protein n=1 Tax=Paenibacillus wulumuqiensis TaxID=1567107 RepID=UPI0006190938|nr:cellulose binding domain-containing protein [Paenibacillus wulumuqiensis]